MSFKTAYSYNENTKIYQGITECQESPLEPGKYLLAAHATFKKPLNDKEGFVVVWNETTEKWEYIEDHRGLVLWKDYDTSITIKQIGPIPEEYKDWTTERPAKPITYMDYDNALQEHLKLQRQDRGYTTRQPSSPNYLNGDNPRWKQDALDWIDHVQKVMEYGLDIENKYIAGESVPTLDEFKAALPVITWTYQITQEQKSK